jgi:uncharacterized membrane protein YeaQ/YmgE (transglycosylase-associated protein family)
MQFVIWLILGLVGGVAGMYAAYRTTPQRAREWIGALVIGLIGGWLGGWLLAVIGLEAVNWLGSIVAAFLGAWIILTIARRTSADPTGVERRNVRAEHDEREHVS